MIEKYLRKTKLRGLSDNSIQSYRYRLLRYRRFYNGAWADITEDDIEEYMVNLQEAGYKAVTINQYVKSIKYFLSWQGIEVKTFYMKENEPIIHAFTQNQLKTLYDACLNTGGNAFSRQRDYMMMRLMEYTGMRIGEVCKLQPADINFKTLTITIKNAKNRQNRVVYFPPGFAKEIRIYLEARQRFLSDKGLAATSLFITTRITQTNRENMLRNITHYGTMAGITDCRVSPHTFRHTFAKNYLLRGGDIYSLKDILGHRSLDMSYRYAKMFDSERASRYQQIMKNYK